MAFSRKMLKAMGIEDEKIEEIIEAHTEVVDALKEQRDNYKVDAEKLPNVQKELDALKAKGDDGWKDKFDKLDADFKKYKSDVEAEKTSQLKKSAVRELLKEAGISDKHAESILRVYDYSKLELDENGKAKDAEERSKAIKTDWSDFIETTKITGANTPNPPANNGGRKTKEEIMAIKDRTERRAEIAKNKDLFGIE